MSFRTRLPRNSPRAETRCLETRSSPSAHSGKSNFYQGTTFIEERSVMKAVQIKSYGDPLEVLEVVDVSEPGPPGANEALLGIEIATLNKHDLLFIGNALGGGPALPTIVGNEGFGRVLAIGRGVVNVKVGDRVLAPLLSQTWREKMIVPASSLFPLPDGDPHQFSMLSGNPPTAALILTEYTQLKDRRG